MLHFFLFLSFSAFFRERCCEHSVPAENSKLTLSFRLSEFKWCHAKAASSKSSKEHFTVKIGDMMVELPKIFAYVLRTASGFWDNSVCILITILTNLRGHNRLWGSKSRQNACLACLEMDMWSCSLMGTVWFLKGLHLRIGCWGGWFAWTCSGMEPESFQSQPCSAGCHHSTEKRDGVGCSPVSVALSQMAECLPPAALLKPHHRRSFFSLLLFLINFDSNVINNYCFPVQALSGICHTPLSAMTLGLLNVGGGVVRTVSEQNLAV